MPLAASPTLVIAAASAPAADFLQNQVNTCPSEIATNDDAAGSLLPAMAPSSVLSTSLIRQVCHPSSRWVQHPKFPQRPFLAFLGGCSFCRHIPRHLSYAKLQVLTQTAVLQMAKQEALLATQSEVQPAIGVEFDGAISKADSRMNNPMTLTEYLEYFTISPSES
jgi:hypothetical protein